MAIVKLLLQAPGIDVTARRGEKRDGGPIVRYTNFQDYHRHGPVDGSESAFDLAVYHRHFRVARLFLARERALVTADRARFKTFLKQKVVPLNEHVEGKLQSWLCCKQRIVSQTIIDFANCKSREVRPEYAPYADYAPLVEEMKKFIQDFDDIDQYNFDVDGAGYASRAS